MNAVILQGDQYYIPFIVKQNGTELTDQNVSDLKIKVSDITKKFSNGDISYSSFTVGTETKSAWMFPITQTQTLSWSAGVIPFQVGVKIDDVIVNSETGTLNIDPSIIQEAW